MNSPAAAAKVTAARQSSRLLRHHDRSRPLVRIAPGPLGLSARNQRINVVLDIAEGVRTDDPSLARRSLAVADRMLDDLEEDWNACSELGTRSFRSAKLGMRLTAWRAALLSGDRSAAQVARAGTWAAAGPWILPRDREKILNFEDAAIVSGLLEPHVGQDLAGSWVPDRASLRSPAA